MKKIIILLLTVILSSGVVKSQIDNDNKAKIYLDEAEKLYVAQNYTGAFEYISKAETVINGTNGEILNLKIKIFYDLHRYIEAQTALNDFGTYANAVSPEIKDEAFSYSAKIEEALEKEIFFWENINTEENRLLFQLYLKKYPNGTYYDIANNKIIEITEQIKTSGNYFIDSRDNKMYKTVKIGTQVWMAENLAYKPSIGNYWAYDNDQSYVSIYGYLYDWETSNKVCPSGWHLPSDAEWTELTDYLGGEEVAGEKLKSSAGWLFWNGDYKGNNLSGFSALSGSSRNYGDGVFNLGGDISGWWSATERDDSDAWTRYLNYDSAEANRYYGSKSLSFSVRCFRD